MFTVLVYNDNKDQTLESEIKVKPHGQLLYFFFQ